MDTQPVTNPRKALTAEQRRVLGKVYQFLIETGQKRLQRLAQDNQAGKIEATGTTLPSQD